MGNTPPTAHAIYEEDYDNGTIRCARGSNIYSTVGSNPSIKKETSHPELFTTMYAAALLNKDIENACLALDAKRGMKEL